MKTLVLGIVAVFCLQMVFVGYTSIERRWDSLRGVGEVAGDFARVAEMPVRPESQIEGVSDPMVTPVSIPDRRIVRRSERSHLPSARPAFVRQIKYIAPPAVVAKRVPAEIDVRKEYEIDANSVREETVAKKGNRSFISKSVAVVKKPYDWLKALGSKLN